MNKKAEEQETETETEEFVTETEADGADSTDTTEEETTGEDETETETEADGADSADTTEEVTTDEDSHDSDEITVSIGEEAPPTDKYAKAPSWVKELRKANRDKDKRIRDLEAKLNQNTEAKPVALGKKPTLEDHDYDAEAYEKALADWFEQKRAADAQAEETQKTEQAQKQAWQQKLESYARAKTELKVRDYEDAEATAQEVLNVTQQGIILQGSDNPALVIYALGKNPAKAATLAKLDDPVKFAFAVAKLEKDLKVTKNKTTPPPERTVNGTGRNSGAVDSTLERLRKEAEKTGNYTKVSQYRKQKREAAQN